MSDSELKDDWTTLIAKEASALRSGQAWADIFDDDDEDTGVSNEATEQVEESETALNTENNEKPVDYLDDIDLAIPLPQPKASVSTPTHFHSDDEFYHPSEDSDNWRARETKSGAESDNWRKRDPAGVKPTSFASFSNKDRFEEKKQQQEERKEYRKPEKRRIDPEDAAALQKWNTFHLVVAQEELEKEKEKERLKNLYLESCNNDDIQSTELVKEDTNQQSGINSSESQGIIESVSNNNASEKEAVKTKPPPPHDDEKVASKEKQLIVDSSNINEETKEDLIHVEKSDKSEEPKDDVKTKEDVTEENIKLIDKSIEHGEEKDNDSKNAESSDKETGDVLSTEPEVHGDMITKVESGFEKKHESPKEDTLSLPKQEEFNDETTTGNESISKESDPNNEKEEMASAKEKDELACDEKEPVLVSKKVNLEQNQIEKTNLKMNDWVSSIPKGESSEKVENDKNNLLAQPEQVELPKDSGIPSKQPIQDEHCVGDDKPKDIKENGTVKESNEDVNSVKIPSESQLEAATEHPSSEYDRNEKILEKGDSLQEIKEEYADLEKQKLKDTKESEESEIVGVKEKEEQEERCENLQAEHHAFDSIQLENDESTHGNVQNDNKSYQSGNSTTDETLKMSTLDTTNSNSQAPIQESDQTDTTKWEETSVKEKTGWGSATGWNQEPPKDIKNDGSKGSEESKKQDQGNSWNQEIVQDNKLDNSNGWSQVPVQQWGASDWNQKSSNVKSESDHSWGTETKIQSPKVETKKPLPGSWRDQIASAPKDDSAGGWKQFATDQAALNIVREPRVESPKPKKAFLPKNVHSSPKLEKSWASDSTSWSKKSDATQATSSSSTQSDVLQADPPLLPTNQQSWSNSPIVSHNNNNNSWSNTPASSLKPSDMSHKEPSASSSTSTSASNPWAEFSALEKERSARSKTQSKQSQSQAPSQVQPQLQHETTQTTPHQPSAGPPVVSISLSDFDSVQLEHKNEERPNAPIEINVSWNGGDIIIDPPAENPRTMHVPLVVSLDDEPQEVCVTPKFEHATLAANPTWSNHSTGWSTAHSPEKATKGSSHANTQRMPMDGSQWKMASHFLDK